MSVTQPGHPPEESFERQEGASYSLSRSGHCLFIVKSGVSTRDIADVAAGTIRLALYEDGPVLFLLYRFGENEWEEVPFAWHKERNGEKVCLYEEVDGLFEYSFHIVLAESSGNVAATRELTLDAEFAAELHGILLRQSKAIFNAHSFLKHINSVYNRLDVSEMAELAAACFKSS